MQYPSNFSARNRPVSFSLGPRVIETRKTQAALHEAILHSQGRVRPAHTCALNPAASCLRLPTLPPIEMEPDVQAIGPGLDHLDTILAVGGRVAM